jgi:hypothetical protein
MHHRMAHAPFAKIQEMAKQGALPRRLANCPIPTCTACLYRKAGKKPWRGKQTKDKELKAILKPGDITSVNQMNSSTLGLVAQISRNPTTKRYKCATIFVDQSSRMGFVYLQISSSAKDTIEAKLAWEAYEHMESQSKRTMPTTEYSERTNGLKAAKTRDSRLPLPE